MIWIHLITWAGLFIWVSRMRKKTENHRLVRRIFCLAATGNLLGAALTVGATAGSGAETEPFLKRGALGSQPAKEELRVSLDGGKFQRITVDVPAMEYSQEEVENEFNAVTEALDEVILGENSSFLSVDRNLELVTELENSPVAVSWETDKPLLVDCRGTLSDEIPEEGEEVTLEAQLTLQGEEEEYQRTIRVYPPRKEGEENLEKRLLAAVREANKDHADKENYMLPQVLDGQTLSWSRPPDYTGIEILCLSLIGSMLYGMACYREEEKKKKTREEQMLRDYPEIISKMVLLLGAGLGMRKIFQRMAGDYQHQRANGIRKEKRYAYEEILLTCQEMESGIPEQEAYERMGMRCQTGKYRSLAGLLTQNLTKGSKGLLELLKQEAQEAFENRRRQAKAAGETAQTRLLLPMGMMLAVVLVLLTVPAFLSFYA